MTTMTDAEIAAWLERNQAWEFVGGELSRTWKFRDFVAAIRFVDRAAGVAEAAQHHPDIDIRYNVVRLGLVTHDAGGVTQKDADMAERLSHDFGD